jgi:hypothetical protein
VIKDAKFHLWFDKKPVILAIVSSIKPAAFPRVDAINVVFESAQADDLRIAQRFSAENEDRNIKKACEAGDRYTTANDSERVKEATSANVIESMGAQPLSR